MASDISWHQSQVNRRLTKYFSCSQQAHVIGGDRFVLMGWLPSVCSCQCLSRSQVTLGKRWLASQREHIDNCSYSHSHHMHNLACKCIAQWLFIYLFIFMKLYAVCSLFFPSCLRKAIYENVFVYSTRLIWWIDKLNDSTSLTSWGGKKLHKVGICMTSKLYMAEQSWVLTLEKEFFLKINK